mgnify:FL=1
MAFYSRIRDLCNDLNMHKTTYTNYEQGKHSVPLDYIAGLTNDKKGLSKSQLSDYETEVIHKLRTLKQNVFLTLLTTNSFAMSF